MEKGAEGRQICTISPGSMPWVFPVAPGWLVSPPQPHQALSLVCPSQVAIQAIFPSQALFIPDTWF